jgi:Cof subfamily protein (haloacid dehalogenase superfamily)
MRLFATDLDGTLVAPGELIHPRDRAAIATARERGVLVTIATGRLTNRTHPLARSLGLVLPLVCADGAVLTCGATQRVLRRHPLPSDLIDDVLARFEHAGLASFVLTDDVIHSCQRGASYHVYMQGWSDTITAHADVRTASAWRAEPEAVIMLLGIGEPGVVEALSEVLAPRHAHADVSSFDTGRGRVLRVVAKGISKGAALAELARELGIAREHVAVAGDFWNDLSMFEFAGRSFAMPHAPAGVKAAATHALDHDVARHGSFADALEQWLDDVS